ncbi:MAG: DegQ family serine endoprotease [Nitrospirae bacterium]|nr:DegQ family serine endoprotease [Nitrospirota bacterium]
MNKFLHRKRIKGLLLAILLIGLGITAGMIISSDLGLFSSGEAVNEGVRKVSVPLPFTGQSFVDVAKTATPAVVNISTTRKVAGPGRSPLDPFFEDPFFRRFFGDEFQRRGVPKERKEQSLGSGVIVDPGGLIVTNNHVVSQADEIVVLLSDRREFKGKLIGTDPKSDIAVVKIEAKDLPFLAWGDSDKLQVGEYALAIGNPFGLNQTVTAGIISAVGRANVGIAEYEDFIQTDAAINPGNSGGALVNVKGELIGINTAIFSRSGGYMGIGFAVPSSMAKAVVDSLVKSGKVVRGWLGVSIQVISQELAKEFGLKDNKGVLVSDVAANSPAGKGGLLRGDVITEYDGKVVDEPNHLRNMVAQTPIGKKVRLKIMRDKREKEIELAIGELPAEAQVSGEERSEGVAGNVLEGLEVADITPDIARELGLSKGETGVVVTSIIPGSPIEGAGLQEGDVITEINRKPVRNTKDFDSVVSRIKANESALILVTRAGRKSFIIAKP